MKKSEKLDVLSLLLKSYFLSLLNELSKSPRRFKELRKHVPNDATLSVKLKELRASGLIEIKPAKVGDSYANYYLLSRRGKRALEIMSKI
ncbi:MAG: winged helix-turn-helix transcriptional regulator [Candidatus Micrarchaeota archaeon]|nr:winged helix-turn-helix transcriptional regulator [Candidatus Micrarchaeota archaeon]